MFAEVLNHEECAKTRGEIYSQLEQNHAGFSLDDRSTWSLLSSKTYGLPPTQAIFTPQLLSNRQNPKVVAAYRAVLEDDAILMSQDRWCAYRPSAANPEWQTRGNLHLDVQPWGYLGGETNIEQLQYVDLVDFVTEINAANRATGPHVQGVLNLLDNRDADGGTQLVPGFHNVFDAWLEALGPVRNSPLATKNPLEGTDGLRRPPLLRGATQSISDLSMR